MPGQKPKRGLLRRDILGAAAGASLGSGFVRHAAAQPSDGFYVPAEERRHDATFMQWPTALSVYDGDRDYLYDVQSTIAEVANTIAEFEPVIMLAAESDHRSVRRRLTASITLWDVPTEDLWCRDAGPVFVVDDRGNRAIRQIQFNGWGGKQIHRRDRRIARRVAEQLDLPFLETDLVGEAGGVEQDGHGLLLAHESSWVNDNRNPGMTRDQLSDALLAAYGAERILWSPGVWGEDITDYHIDSLVRLTGENRALINLPDDPDPNDAFHMAALDTYDVIVEAGLAVEVIPEPVQRRVTSLDFVASYANYYICNGGVISAQFGDPEADALARDALGRHFPDREIVQLNVDPLGELGGGIHCATQQMPVA